MGRELALACTDMGGQLAIEGIPDAENFAERGLALSRQLGLSDVTVKALVAIGLGVFVTGDPAQSLATLDEALQLARVSGLGRETALIYNNAAVTTWSTTGPQDAIRLCEEGLEFAERRGFAELASGLRSTRHAFLFDLGRWSDSSPMLPWDIDEASAAKTVGCSPNCWRSTGESERTAASRRRKMRILSRLQRRSE